jgi:phosphohistidine phosphatase
MKTLILVRHAKSDWANSALTDFDRPLNSRGKKDASFMADVLKDKGINPDNIISSPALRAITTAEKFSEILSFPLEKIQLNERIYHGNHKEIISIIKKIDDKNDLSMLFGHNPDITTVVSQLSDAIVDNMPTCSIACIDFDIKSWFEISNEIKGKLRFFDYPKNY